MAKKIITCCDKCAKQVTGKQAFTIPCYLISDVDGKKLYEQPGYSESMRTRSEVRADITLCRTCIMGMLEEPRVFRTPRSTTVPEQPTTRRPFHSINEEHDAYGDPGPGAWEPTEENGGRGGPGDR